MYTHIPLRFLDSGDKYQWRIGELLTSKSKWKKERNVQTH